MKFYNYDVVFQEIPDEVSLAVNITNCPNHCLGCHSPHLWKDEGIVLDSAMLDTLAAKYRGLITCVCLMGGDADRTAVEQLARHIKQSLGLKVGWYSGKNEFPTNPDYFDYVKIGPYIPENGGLKSPTTNQRLYHRTEGEWQDITCRFWK